MVLIQTSSIVPLASSDSCLCISAEEQRERPRKSSDFPLLACALMWLFLGLGGSLDAVRHCDSAHVALMRMEMNPSQSLGEHSNPLSRRVRHTHARVHARMRTHTHTYQNTHTQICVRTYTQTHTHTQSSYTKSN